MLRKLKELHQTCGILTDLYLEYSETYPDIDFRPINFNIAFSGEGQFEAFIDLKFNFDKETVFITYNDPYESHFDETYPIPMKLIGKPKNEIEKWYKQKVEDLKEKQAEEQAAKVYAFKLQIERLTEELKQLNP